MEVPATPGPDKIEPEALSAETGVAERGLPDRGARLCTRAGAVAVGASKLIRLFRGLGLDGARALPMLDSRCNSLPGSVSTSAAAAAESTPTKPR